MNSALNIIYSKCVTCNRPKPKMCVQEIAPIILLRTKIPLSALREPLPRFITDESCGIGCETEGHAEQ